MPESKIKQKAFGNVLTIRIVTSVAGDEFTIGILSCKPSGCPCVFIVEGSMRSFVNKGFFENSGGQVLGSLTRVDEKVVVATSKRFVPFVNPDGLYVLPDAFRQSTDDHRVFRRLCPSRINVAKLRVNLDFYIRSVAKACVK